MAVVNSNKDEFYGSLTKFHDIVAYLYGPYGRQVALQNDEGTVIRIVTSSNELFTHLQLKNYVLKLLVNILKTNSFMYCDGGLFTGLLASNIILKLHLEDISFNAFTNAKTFLLKSIEIFIDRLKINVNVGKIEDFLGLIRPILGSKLLLKVNEIIHLSIIFVKAFASSHTKNMNNVIVLVNSNNEIMDSSLHEGCLLYLGRYSEKEIDLSCKLSEKKIILLSSSLSLSSDDFVAETGSRITANSFCEFKDDIVFSQLIDFSTKLVSFADIVLCQKVVHPFIKSYFRDNNVLCVDRIGAMMMPKLEKLCGCNMISILSSDDIGKYIGAINHIETITLNKKVYLKLASNIDYSTLLLCGVNESEGENVKSCYLTSMSVLKDVFSQPHVLYAGGCTETILSMFLLNLPRQTPENFGYSSITYQKFVLIVVKSLLDIASNIEKTNSYFEHHIDRTFNHHWMNASTSSCCCCGLIKKDKSSLTFISFKELMMLNISGSWCLNYEASLHNDSLSFLSQSKNMYWNNIIRAFQAAEIILRIGYQVV